MKKIICFECGSKNIDPETRKETRIYEGEGYSFKLEVDIPYCKDCGSKLYDREKEQAIREKAHNIIIEQRNILVK